MPKSITITLNAKDKNFESNIRELQGVAKHYEVHTVHGKIISARYFKHVLDDVYEFEHHIKSTNVIDDVYVTI